MKTLINKIAGRLSGHHEDHLTVVEGQIAKLLLNAGHLHKDDQGNLIDNDLRPEIIEVVESTFIQKLNVIDPDSRLPVEVEIRKMANGPMVGFDGCFLDQLGPGENPHSPYDPSLIVNVPDDPK